ncbi:MAG TPA: twin-arginine translocation signal domain-containing protein [Longimicrobiales bacterium]|nr:twin-arginine translocation signal domain-containing protein [Longimicrobiales bacterium]
MSTDPHPYPDRRGFLRGVAGGGLALALAGWIPEEAHAYARPRQGLMAFTAKEHAVARAAAEALLMDAPVDPGYVADELDREAALMGEPIRSDLKTVLNLLEHLTILGGRFQRFTSLDPEARLAYLNGWATSRFNLRRAAFQGLRSLIHFIGWAEPETREITGFLGTWPDRFDYPAYPVDFGEIA